MPLRQPHARPGHRRGHVLIMFVIALTALLGMLGLVIDTGMMMTAQRQVQNVADSVALASAMNLMLGGTAGGSGDTVTAVATAFAVTDNGLTGADVVVNSSPTSSTNNVVV